jgi:transposase
VAEAVLCSQGTVVGVRRRFVEEGWSAALYDKPRPGQAPKITGEIEAQLVMLACSDAPAGQARWTLRLLAEHLVELTELESISHVAVGERLKKMNLSPGG